MKLKVFIIIFILIGILYIGPFNKNIEKYSSNREINNLRRKLRNQKDISKKYKKEISYLKYKLRYEKNLCENEKRRLRNTIKQRIKECRTILKNNNRNISQGLGLMKNKMNSHVSRDKILRNLYKLKPHFKFSRK
jgi:hypothetical protein